MKKPASAGAHGLSGNVVFAGDAQGYGPEPSAIQVSILARRYGLTPAVAAVVAALAYPKVDNWRGAR